MSLPGETTPALQEFPLYYPRKGEFLVNGQPSGAIGATAELQIPLTNAPHIITGIRICNFYTADDFELYPLLRQGLVDEDQEVEVSLAQQNITAGYVHQRALTGGPLLWQPFSVPFGAAGSNNWLIRIRRLVAYPAGVSGITAAVTLFASQLNASMFAGTPAPGPVPRGR